MIHVYPARETDYNFLRELRNSEDVFKQCRRDFPLDQIDFRKTVEGKDVFVILFNRMRCGQIRFDPKGDALEIGISIHQMFRGRGIAQTAIKKGIQVFSEKGHKIFLAQVKKNNSISLQLFKSLKFQEVSEEGEYINFIFRA